MSNKPIPFILIEKDGVLKPFKEISKSTLEKFRELNQYLREFEISQSVLPLVKSNALELDEYVKHIESINHDVSIERLEYLQINDKINRLLLNFLTSGRLYLDHTETRLNRRYGEESKQLKKFTKATNNAYDDLFVYRFFYKLRNFVQHCGMAIDIKSKFSSSRNIPGQVDTHKMNVRFDPEYLLANYDSWGPVKNDLKREKGMLTVRGFAPEALNALQLIDRYTYLAEHPKLYEAGNWILDLLEDAFNEGENPQIGTLTEKGKIIHANFSIPAFDVLQVVGVVDFTGKETGNSLIEYFPMFGHCFKLKREKEKNKFTVTCPSIPELLVRGKSREKVIDKTEVEFKSLMKQYLQNKKDHQLLCTGENSMNL